jgi:nitroreductase
MDVFEAMETCRAMRRLKPDPVPRDLLEKLVHYATMAPSAGNSQQWRFLVVTDAEDKAFFGSVVRNSMESRLPPESTENTRAARAGRAFRHLVLHFDQVPAIIFPCVENAYPPGDPNPLFMWSTIYPATQNLLLAARALGLGTAMTTFHILDEAAVKKHFDIPDSTHIGATIPVGYPEGRFGPVRRRPVSDVIHWDRWSA